MALGVIKIIPASSHVTASLTGSTTAGGGQLYNACAILNPNDGVLYVAQNRDCPDIGYGSWDWKVPSQSYALLPGHFHSVGMYYLDQSGSGRQGEVTVYPSSSRVDIPIFQAIGRALQTLGTTLDITESPQPQNPGSGILRLWGDGTDILHLLNGAGVDRSVIDTVRALGGVLTGTLPNPGFAAGAVLNNIAARSICQINYSATSTTISTTSGAFVATGDIVSLNTQSTASLLLAFYYGPFTNSVAGAFNQFYLGIDGASSLGASAMSTKVATNYDQILAIAYGTGLSVGNHVFQAFWATNTGTLSSSGLARNVLAMEITK